MKKVTDLSAEFDIQAVNRFITANYADVIKFVQDDSGHGDLDQADEGRDSCINNDDDNSGLGDSNNRADAQMNRDNSAHNDNGDNNDDNNEDNNGVNNSSRSSNITAGDEE